MPKNSVAFIGLGYIGLPTAVMMAQHGLDVTGVDVLPEKVRQINDGEISIVEPGLEDALKDVLAKGTFHATTAVPHADAYIIAVPTPFTSSHDVDMKFIYSAAESIAPQLVGDELVVLESTSPPLTTQKMAERILELRPDLSLDNGKTESTKPVIHVAHCPERILPGRAMEELRTNARIIGGISSEATRRATEIYSSFCEGELLQTNARTAELSKLTENSFRDVNIAFANELSLICEKLDIDVWELIRLANHHPRVNILQPGPGVGGHCIAVDPWFIVSAAPEEARLIHTARLVNDSKPEWVFSKVQRAVEDNNATDVAVLGLSFKADIDDLRESPSLHIAQEIAQRLPGISVHAVEPNISKLPESLEKLNNVTLDQLAPAISQSQIVLLLVDHKPFKEVTAAQLKNKTVIDTKGLWI